jgi:hypothetical protein
MRAITIRQPYASLIAAGIKRLETRSWTTSYRGPLLIHAAQAPASWPSRHSDRALKIAKEHNLLMPTGAIVGIATLQNVIYQDDFARDADLARMVTPLEREMGHFYPGWFAWWLTFAYRLKKPIRCAGNINLWTPRQSVLDKLPALCQQEA